MLDSQICFEIIFTFERIIINGLDSAVNNVHREIFKVAKTHLYDRAMSCLIAVINQNNFVYTNQLDGNVTLDFRALDGSNNEFLDIGKIRFEPKTQQDKYLENEVQCSSTTYFKLTEEPLGIFYNFI
ncbi:unnamed protein product [Rotaria sp. Silwood1]|nr:unnamed protein product [Rotaria sp. Silwood1]